MAGDFAFYSKDIDPTAVPSEADPAPATLVVLDQPPFFGDHDLMGGEIGRGSVHRTLGGCVIQDFGVEVCDQRIAFSDIDALSAATVAALKTVHETVDGSWYFTDGYNVWQVRFARPGGFVYRRNLRAAYHGVTLYSYEINLIVEDKKI